MKFQTRLLKNLVKSLLLPSLLATCLLLRTALEPRNTDSTRLPAVYTKKKCGLRVVFCRKLLATGYASEVTQASDLEVDFFKRGISELPPYPIQSSTSSRNLASRLSVVLVYSSRGSPVVDCQFAGSPLS